MPAATRTALLEAAAAVFVEYGYRGATVREICRRARANVAAVNYHFGDKAGLYCEVLRHVHNRADEKHPLALVGSETLSPAKRLDSFVRSLLFHLLDTDTDAAGSRLMSREMMEPTVALDLVVAEYVQPVADELRAIVNGFLGPGASEEQIRAGGMSIVSQCLFYHQCEPMIRRLFPDTQFTPAHLERLARHITRFSIAGLKEVGKAMRTR